MTRNLTAQELAERDARDPVYQAMMAEKLRQLEPVWEMRRQDEKPVVEALVVAGGRVGGREITSVWDLVNTVESYPHLLDTLAEHITRPYLPDTKEPIARALAVREAKGTRIPRILMEELKTQTDPNQGPNSYRWVLINTLLSIGDASLMDDVRQLLVDPRYASVRTHLQRLTRLAKRPAR